MKNKLNNVLSIFALAFFAIIAIASSEGNSNTVNQGGTEQEPMDYIETNDSPSDYYEYIEEDNQYAEGWKIYHAYKPNYDISSECESRTCEYCNEEYYAKKIKYIEIPDVNNPFQMLNIVTNHNESSGDIGLLIGGIGDLSVDDDLIDYENKTITTEWDYKCIFDDLNFCSRKCKRENNFVD
jgi:hypothetical protein